MTMWPTIDMHSSAAQTPVRYKCINYKAKLVWLITLNPNTDIVVM